MNYNSNQVHYHKGGDLAWPKCGRDGRAGPFAGLLADRLAGPRPPSPGRAAGRQPGRGGPVVTRSSPACG